MLRYTLVNMPKKFKGENSKASEARARKAAVQHAAQAKREQELEDEYWKDEDKHVQKKQQRKDEKEKKKNELLERKQQLKQLHDEEMSALPGKASARPSKLTRAQVEANVKKMEEASKAKKEEDLTHIEKPLEENVNVIQVEGVEARSVEDAIAALSTNDTETVERHPERRVKAAYAAYEEENLPRLKQENPNMRLSQLKQMLKKDWQKSPQNPLNQRSLAYNAKAS
ncbi:coiled-coil domain-containing protein 124 isoform X2 [Lingula anatina]|uniref:Coiled-coil domain-containing protein 124 isoform X2 n=1 Tax=Lingula anatina TaxID=7574 RepID=A0A1S3IY41_LINAN|nr:coiled-coil domain-containing protein 124 isoform X2 [Lingula anatina]|eukprot:XP_013403117.1 coiled-coil domain-containing protein 124 isoform X2 [Lingula anatina]